jgi:hypothetical protein
VAVAPADDAGASTADRYDWQAAMAAADGLALYLDALGDGELRADSDGRIVCEHHEDWVVVRGGDAELVSAKHREPSYGVFTTLSQLAGDGGLAHLFGRWHALEEKPACRLVTTAGLAPGAAPCDCRDCPCLWRRTAQQVGSGSQGRGHTYVRIALVAGGGSER